MRQDIRFALRAMANSPTFTAVAIVCLAIGIGANSAMYGILDALLFRPPAGVGRPDEVVRIDIQLPQDRRPRGPGARVMQQGGAFASYPDFTDLRDRTDVFSSVAAYSTTQVTLGSGTEARQLSAVLASGGYFRVLDTKPALGRFFPPDEDRIGRNASPVAVLSHELWRRQFGADPAVIGRTLELNGRTFTITGVAPPHFTGVDLGTPDLWVPLLSLAGTTGPDRTLLTTRNAIWLRLLGRLKPGVLLPRALTAATAVVRAADDEFAQAFRGPAPAGLVPRRTVVLSPVSARVDRAAGQESPVPVWLLAVTGIVLLIACANVAGLLLARGAARRRELAIRLSLGASRGRLVRQLLTESVLLALAAGLAAVVISLWSVRLLNLLPLPPIDRPIDLRVAAFTILGAALTSVLFGLVPALAAARTAPANVLREETAGPGGTRARLRNGLTIAQLALSIVLLIGAGLFFRSLRNVQAIDTGYDLDHLLLASVNLRARGYTDAAARELYRRAAERVRALSGVEATALANVVPFQMRVNLGIRIPGREERPEEPIIVSTSAIDPEYFRTVGLPLRAGRPFDDRDRAGSTPVAIVNETMAKRFWPDRSALGQCFYTGSPRDAGDGPCLEIVGIVADAKYADLSEPPTPYFYRPLEQAEEPLLGLTLYVRTRGAPDRAAPAVRQAIQSLEPNLPFVNAYPLAEVLRPQVRAWQMGTATFTIFGALALILATIGLYGVITFLVTQRTREVGIRLALGAQRSDVIALVLGHACRLAGAGVALGVAAAAGAVRLVGHRLYGVSPIDPLTYGAVAVLLLAVALAASLVPALRAAAVDPVVALRVE
jgi:putative ABC transport system permease protein